MLDTSEIKFDENGLVPAIAQDSRTGRVLMMAWMDREALEKTIETGRAHFWSRSRRSLWQKGETSGNFLNVDSVRYDCDGDTLLVMVTPEGPACHTGQTSCFYRTLGPKGAEKAGPWILGELFEVLKERKTASGEKSYVASLYAKGLDKILSKVEEESAELIEAAREKGPDDVVYELCDLWFHTMVLLANEGIELDRAFGELARRFGISGIEEKASRGKE